MAQEINSVDGNFILPQTVIPAMRPEDIEFTADSMKPDSLCRIFFDSKAVNIFTQKANKIIVNAQKHITLSYSPTSSIYANDIVSQVESSEVVWTGVIESMDSESWLMIVKDMTGTFNDELKLRVQNVTSGIITTDQAVVGEFEDVMNPDIFENGEGLYNSNTGMYMSVLGTSGENILYVNENYINLSVANSAGSIDVSTGPEEGDLVYQTADGLPLEDDSVSELDDTQHMTFLGRVVYFNPNQLAFGNTLAIIPEFGTLKSNTNLANTQAILWNYSDSTKKGLNASEVKNYLNIATERLVAVDDEARFVDVVEYQHNSGLISNTAGQLVSNNTLYLNSTGAFPSDALGSLLYITSGVGLGEFKHIASIAGNVVTLDAPLTIYPSAGAHYSIGNHYVDDNGCVAGIFNAPGESNYYFTSGLKLFAIADADRLDSADISTLATAQYQSGAENPKASGTPLVALTPETNNNLVKPPNPTDPSQTNLQDPVIKLLEDVAQDEEESLKGSLSDNLAQTFTVPKKKGTNKTNYGIFVTSINLFFKKKPKGKGRKALPVTVRISEVVNGYPIKSYLARKTLYPKDVKVSDAPSVDDAKTRTRFKFANPVYLAPDQEYAIVVTSESSEYQLWIAETGKEAVGSDPPVLISQQPYSGVLLKAQNATTWSPYLNQDLMFQINKAVFADSGKLKFRIKNPPRSKQDVDAVVLNSRELRFPATDLKYKLQGIYKSDLTYDSGYYVKPLQKFKYGDILNPGSAPEINSRRIRFGNVNSQLVTIELSTKDPDISPIVNKNQMYIASIENQINNAGMTNTIIDITSGGSGYNAHSLIIKGESSTTLKNAANTYRTKYYNDDANIAFYGITITEGGGSNATGWAVANTAGTNELEYIHIHSPGSLYVETPTLVIANGNATVNSDAQFQVYGETGKDGGNILAKYLTRKITLADEFESGDLHVYMDAVMPPKTEIVVYYKVRSADDGEVFADKPWVKMDRTAGRKSKNMREVVALHWKPDIKNNKLIYEVNGDKFPVGGTFKEFAIKVGLLTSDSAVSPTVRNIRIIAVPEG